MPLKRLVKMALSAAVLWWLFTQAGVADTLAHIPRDAWWVVLAGVGVYMVSQAVSGYRWQFLAKAMGFPGLVRQYFNLYMVGMFFNLFLPGSIGGDGARVYYLGKMVNRPKRQAVLTILAERGVGLLALLILTGVFCLLPQARVLPSTVTQPVLLLSVFTVLGYLGALVFPFSKFAHMGPVAWLQQAEVYWRDGWLMARSVGVSLLVHGFMVAIHLLIAQSLGFSVDPVMMTIVYGVTALVSVIPLFFNGMGIREGAYQLLLGFAGVSASEALAFGLLWLAVSVLTSLIGGLFFALGHYKALPAEFVSDAGLDAEQGMTSQVMA